MSYFPNSRSIVNRQAGAFQQALTQDLNLIVQYLASKFTIQIAAQNFQN
jgi:hypothetical protein